MFVITLGGVLFSGYLSSKKLFTKVCAFNEPCPYFLGYPACGYGFAMFLIMFLSVIASGLGYVSLASLIIILIVISFLGILFAGQFVIPEVSEMVRGIQHKYTLGLSTCAYGLIFYVAIFVISLVTYLS